MRLKIEQLAANLEKRGLMIETADLIHDYARSHGVEERNVLTVDKSFDWHSLRETGANLSLFSSRRLIELKLGEHKPGREGGAILADYAAAPPPDNILLLTCAKLDKQAQQTVWFKKLEASGIVVQIWPVEAAKLPGWIVQRARLLGKTLHREAAALIAQKVEGNLLAARQELEKLCLLVDAPEINLKHVMNAVNDSARYDVFLLIATACMGDIEHAARMLRGLQGEGVKPLDVFGALLWELRRICSMAWTMRSGQSLDQIFSEYRVWQQRQAPISKVLKRLPARELMPLLGAAYHIERQLKGASPGDPWAALEDLLFRLAGVHLQATARP